MRKWHLIASVPYILLLTACDFGSQSSGFTLPAGDAVLGQTIFQQRQCTDCHAVKGVEFEASDVKPLMALQLGGEMRKVYTYGELVTSVINPSHKISNRFPKDTLVVDSESKMRSYNDVLTISELIDLIAFLEAHYELKPYQATRFGPMPG